MAEVCKIRCSGLPRLSAINNYYRERVGRVWDLRSDAFSTAWVCRVSSEKLKSECWAPKGRSCRDVYKRGEWIRIRKEKAILGNCFRFVRNCVRMMESWRMMYVSIRKCKAKRPLAASMRRLEDNIEMDEKYLWAWPGFSCFRIGS